MANDKIYSRYYYGIGFKNDKRNGWLYGILVGVKSIETNLYFYNPKDVLEATDADYVSIYYIFGLPTLQEWEGDKFSAEPFLYVNDIYAKIGAGIPCEVQIDNNKYEKSHIVGVNTELIDDALKGYQNVIANLYEEQPDVNYASKVMQAAQEMFAKLHTNCFTVSSDGKTKHIVGIQEVLLPVGVEASTQNKNIKNQTAVLLQKIEQERVKNAQRNVTADVLISEIRLKNIAGFRPNPAQDTKYFIYKPEPSINLILGKNGHFKTEFLRLLTMALLNEPQNKDIVGNDWLRFFKKNGSVSIYADWEKDDYDKAVKLRYERQDDHIASSDETELFPILAIQDHRIFTKGDGFWFTIKKADEKDTYIQFMENFISQSLDLDKLLAQVLTRLAIEQRDYEKQRIEDSDIWCPFARFLTKVVRELTEDEHFVFCEMKDFDDSFLQGDSKIITVRSLYNLSEEPVPIQRLSRGTLSVIYIFGAIYNFIRNAYPESMTFEDVQKKPAIVLIDEIDAHLHPSWQRKIVRLLRESFPKVQYFLTAHSPLCAMGCYPREVAELKSMPNDYDVYIDQKPQDYIGKDINDVLQELFDVGATDEVMERIWLNELVDKVKKMNKQKGGEKWAG